MKRLMILLILMSVSGNLWAQERCIKGPGFMINTMSQGEMQCLERKIDAIADALKSMEGEK